MAQVWTGLKSTALRYPMCNCLRHDRSPVMASSIQEADSKEVDNLECKARHPLVWTESLTFSASTWRLQRQFDPAAAAATICDGGASWMVSVEHRRPARETQRHVCAGIQVPNKGRYACRATTADVWVDKAAPKAEDSPYIYGLLLA
jgi:hypothetical protein